jgi:hypothetical protein
MPLLTLTFFIYLLFILLRIDAPDRIGLLPITPMHHLAILAYEKDYSPRGGGGGLYWTSKAIKKKKKSKKGGLIIL